MHGRGGPRDRGRRAVAGRAGAPPPARRAGRRPRQGDRLLAARRRAGARAVRVGGGVGALGGGARGHGAHRRGRGRPGRPARRARRADGGDRRSRAPDLLPRARARAVRRAPRRRAVGAGALTARDGALPDRLDLRRPPGHRAGVPPLRRRARGARARPGAQGPRPPRDRRLHRADLRPARSRAGSRRRPARSTSPSGSATRRCGRAPPRHTAGTGSSPATCARDSTPRSAPSRPPTPGSARSWPGWRRTIHGPDDLGARRPRRGPGRSSSGR